MNYQLGISEILRGQPTRAIAPLLRATRLDPEHFAAQIQLARTYYLLAKYEQALEAYARCQELKPQHPELCAELGGLLDRQGRFRTAESVYRAGLAANEDSAQLNYNLGVLLWRLGQFDEARQLLLRAEELGTELSAEVQEAIHVEQ